MKFDVQSALDEILSESLAPATSATPATNSHEVAEVARVAIGRAQNEKRDAENLSESAAPATPAILATNTPNVAEVARVAVKAVQIEDIEFDTRLTVDDPETYFEALRIHGPMSYGMAMRVLGWGATRAGQAEDSLRFAGRIAFNKQGRAVLIDSVNHQNEVAR